MGTLIVDIPDLARIQFERDDGNAFKQLAYITEEVGELSQALLNDEIENAKREALDVAISALSIFYQLGGDGDLMREHVPQALEKWYNNV